MAEQFSHIPKRTVHDVPCDQVEALCVVHHDASGYCKKRRPVSVLKLNRSQASGGWVRAPAPRASAQRG